jgi:hypothetical protein
MLLKENAEIGHKNPKAAASIDKSNVTFCDASLAFDVQAIVRAKKSQLRGPESDRHWSFLNSFNPSTRKSGER